MKRLNNNSSDISVFDKYTHVSIVKLQRRQQSIPAKEKKINNRIGKVVNSCIKITSTTSDYRALKLRNDDAKRLGNTTTKAEVV